MRLIDADAMYERACSLEAQALDYVGKLIERDGDEVSEEWKIWSAILTERTAFKHDVFDAPTIEERKKGKWLHDKDDTLLSGYCSRCGWESIIMETDVADMPYCPNCGSYNGGGDDEADRC